MEQEVQRQDFVDKIEEDPSTMESMCSASVCLLVNERRAELLPVEAEAEGVEVEEQDYYSKAKNCDWERPVEHPEDHHG